MTAEEYAAQLKADPTYRARLEEQARRVVRIHEAESALLMTLSSQGYDARSIDELVAKYAPLPRELANVLVESLGAVSDPNVREAIVRALGAVRGEFKAGPLADLFEQSASPTLQWAIANTLAEARPAGLGAWLIRALQDRRYGKAREMLAVAAARTNAPEVVNPVLVGLLDELPGHAALALAETGGPAELDALLRVYRTATGWEREQVGRTINMIERREEERG